MDPETYLERRGHRLPACNFLVQKTRPNGLVTYLQDVDGLRTSRQGETPWLQPPDFDFSEAEVGFAPFGGLVEE